jgi:hypothetical protein
MAAISTSSIAAFVLGNPGRNIFSDWVKAGQGASVWGGSEFLNPSDDSNAAFSMKILEKTRNTRFPQCLSYLDHKPDAKRDKRGGRTLGPREWAFPAKKSARSIAVHASHRAVLQSTQVTIQIDERQSATVR